MAAESGSSFGSRIVSTSTFSFGDMALGGSDEIEIAGGRATGRMAGNARDITPFNIEFLQGSMTNLMQGICQQQASTIDVMREILSTCWQRAKRVSRQFQQIVAEAKIACEIERDKNEMRNYFGLTTVLQIEIHQPAPILIILASSGKEKSTCE